MVKSKTKAKVVVVGRRKKEEPVVPAVPVDESIDDLLNLQEDETDHFLMHFKRACNSLKQYGFETISSLKLFYDTYGEKYCIRKLTEVKGIGKKKAEDMLTRAVCYKYPKGYIPQTAKIPDWAKTNVVQKELEMEEDNDTPLYPEEGGTAPVSVVTKEVQPITADEADEVSINISEYASQLVDEKGLAAILLSLIFDVFEPEFGSNPERIDPKANPDEVRFEQLNLFYNDSIVLVNKEWLYELFNTKCRTLKTVDNLNRVEMFKTALMNLSCVFKKKSPGDGNTYYWGRKGYYLGSANLINYVEVRIDEAEAMMNRKFNIISSNEIDSVLNDLGIEKKKEPVIRSSSKDEEEEVVSSTTNWYLNPIHCINEGNRKCFKFTLIDIYNRLNFNIKSIDWKYGTYTFREDDIEDGELLLGRGFTDEDYDVITKMVVDFLKVK